MAKNIKKNIEEKVSRDDVLKAYKNILKTSTIRDPQALDETQPEVKAAKELFDAYRDQCEKEMKAAKNKRSYYQTLFDLDTVYLDAGFDDPEFLGDTVNDFLMQATPKVSDAPGEDITDVIKKFVAMRKKFGGWIAEDEEASGGSKKSAVKKGAGAKPGTFSAWKKIKLGTCASAEEIEKKLAEAGYVVSKLGKPLLDKMAVAEKESTIELIKIQAQDLGFKARVDRVKLFAAADNAGLALVPAEAGPQLALQYADQPKGETIFIAMEPLMDTHDDPNVFYVSRDPEGKWFGSNYDIPDDAKRGSTQWVFLLKK
jgi:hypothetical protein